MKKTISEQLKEKSIFPALWAKNKNLLRKDYNLLKQLAISKTKGCSKGRTRELLEMLKDDGLVA